MYCENEKGKIDDLSSKEYASCAGGKCGGWKFLSSGCAPWKNACQRSPGAWLPATEVCRLNLYAKFKKRIKPTAASSSSSIPAFSSSSTSETPVLSLAILSSSECSTTCDSGCCPREGWFCCADGIYCAATESDCPTSGVGILATTSVPLYDPNVCEGSKCPTGCCPEENWFCCPDGNHCAMSEEYCPSAAVELTGDPTLISGVEFAPADYFATELTPMQFVSGSTAGEFVVPKWLGLNRAVYINTQGDITDEYVAPRQVINFRSTIVLGYDPEGSEDASLPPPPEFTVESMGNEFTVESVDNDDADTPQSYNFGGLKFQRKNKKFGVPSFSQKTPEANGFVFASGGSIPSSPVYKVVVAPAEGASGVVFRFNGVAIRPSRIGPSQGTEDGLPNIQQNEYLYLTDLNGYAMTAASTNRNGIGVFSDAVLVGGGCCHPSDGNFYTATYESCMESNEGGGSMWYEGDCVPRISSSSSSSRSSSSSSSIPAPSRPIRSADYACPNSCPSGCCDEEGWFCCADGIYCAATEADCPASEVGVLALSSKPLFDPTVCEGTECPAGCCPGENWFCCPDNIYCASTAADCPSAAADITGEPTTIAGVEFDPADFFDTSLPPMRFISGATAGEFVIPEWLGFNRAVYINAQGGIADEYVAPRQIVRFRSTIVLGYDPEGSQAPSLPAPPLFAVESVGNQETGPVYNVTVDPVADATGYVFRFEGVAIRPSRIGPAPATPEGWPEITAGQYQYLMELDGQAMTVASVNQNGTGVFSHFVTVGYKKCTLDIDCMPCERCVVNGTGSAFMGTLNTILCYEGLDGEGGECHCASRCVGEELCCGGDRWQGIPGECKDFCCENNSQCDSDLCQVCFDGECISECGLNQMCCDGVCKKTCCDFNFQCGECKSCVDSRCKDIPNQVICGGECKVGLSCCESDLNCGPCQRCGPEGTCISNCDEVNKYCCYGTCRSTKCCQLDSECGECEICNTGDLTALKIEGPINTCVYTCSDDQCCGGGGCQPLPCCLGNGDCDASKCEICFKGECISECGLDHVCCDGTCKYLSCFTTWNCEGETCTSVPTQWGRFESKEVCDEWCSIGVWCGVDADTRELDGNCQAGNKISWLEAASLSTAADFLPGETCETADCIDGDCYRTWQARVDCETGLWTVNDGGYGYCGGAPEEGTDAWFQAALCVYIYTVKLGPCKNQQMCDKYINESSIPNPSGPSVNPPSECCECPDACEWIWRSASGTWEPLSGGIGVRQSVCRISGCDCPYPVYGGSMNLEVTLTACREPSSSSLSSDGN